MYIFNDKITPYIFLFFLDFHHIPSGQLIVNCVCIWWQRLWAAIDSFSSFFCVFRWHWTVHIYMNESNHDDDDDNIMKNCKHLMKDDVRPLVPTIASLSIVFFSSFVFRWLCHQGNLIDTGIINTRLTRQIKKNERKREKSVPWKEK